MVTFFLSKPVASHSGYRGGSRGGGPKLHKKVKKKKNVAHMHAHKPCFNSFTVDWISPFGNPVSGHGIHIVCKISAIFKYFFYFF